MDGLEAEFAGRLIILRVNIQEKAGRELAPLYGFQYTPTFILFDAEGNEVWRQIGGLNTDRVRESLK